MKIVIINGQNHKGSTYHIGHELVDQIDTVKEVDEFFLPRDLNHFCLGCYNCIEDETKCPFYEEKSVIMDKVAEADLLVITTPNYCLAPSGALKAFLDLTFVQWMVHKPKKYMFRKKAVVISTAAGAGTSSAIKPVARSLFYWGIPWIKKYGISVQAMNWESVSVKKKEKINKDMAKLAKKIAKEKKPHVPIKTKFMFWMMGNMQKANWGSGPAEKKYWEEKGWLQKERPWK